MSQTTENKTIPRPVQQRTEDGFTALSSAVNGGSVSLMYKLALNVSSTQGYGGFLEMEGAPDAIARAKARREEAANGNASSPQPTCNAAIGGARCMVAPNEIDNEVFYKYGRGRAMATVCYNEWVAARSLLKHCNFLPYFMRPHGVMRNRVIMEYTYPEDEVVQFTERHGIDPFAIMRDDECSVNATRISAAAHGGATVSGAYKDSDIRRTLDGKALRRRVVDVGVFESLRDARSAYDLHTGGAERMASVTYQLIMAVLIARKRCGFVHNDLHWTNVMLVKCDPKLHVLFHYAKADGTRLSRVVPTHGLIPIIIDYGFAYTDDLVGHHPEVLYADNSGHITYETDGLVDVMYLLREYSVLAKSSELAKEVGQYLESIKSRRNTAYRYSWLYPERNLSYASYCARLAMALQPRSTAGGIVVAAAAAAAKELSASPDAEWLRRAVVYSIRQSDELMLPVYFSTRIDDLDLIDGAEPTDSFETYPENKLYERLYNEVTELCTRGVDPNVQRNDVLLAIMAALSHAVRVNTHDRPVTKKKRNSRGVLLFASKEEVRANSDDTDMQVYMQTLDVRRAASSFVSRVNTELATRISAARRDKRPEVEKQLRTVQSNMARCPHRRLVSTMFALAAKESMRAQDHMEDDINHVKRGIRLPLKRYVAPSVSTGRAANPPGPKDHVAYRNCYKRFLEKWAAWADHAGPAGADGTATRVSSEIEYVVRRFLSDCIRHCTRPNPQDSGATYVIDAIDAQRRFLANVRSELEIFNRSNECAFEREVEAAVERVSSFCVDWVEICYVMADLVMAAGNQLNSAASDLRKFRDGDIRARAGTGEQLFFRFEEKLHRHTKLSHQHPGSDPVLRIDSIEGVSSMTTIGEIQLKKSHAIHGRRAIHAADTRVPYGAQVKAAQRAPPSRVLLAAAHQQERVAPTRATKRRGREYSLENEILPEKELCRVGDIKRGQREDIDEARECATTPLKAGDEADKNLPESIVTEDEDEVSRDGCSIQMLHDSRFPKTSPIPPETVADAPPRKKPKY
jgi:hypothetical protein